MSAILKFINSSIGKKQVMALSALMLCGFTLTHLLGNLLMFFGPRAFNMYAHTLTSSGIFIVVAEILLAIIFLSHVFMGIRLTIENRMARPNRYAVNAKTGRGKTTASRTMPITGMITLVFIGLHLTHFRLGTVFTVDYNGLIVRDVYRSVILLFQQPGYIIFYVFSMLSLGLHLSHGVASMFQSLGFNHALYTPLIKMKGLGFAILIAIAFSIFPVWSFFQGAYLS